MRSNTFSAICSGWLTVSRVSVGNCSAASDCVAEGGNVNGVLGSKESKLALLRQDTLTPLSHTAFMRWSKSWILTKTLRWSTTAFNSCGCESLPVSLSVLRPVSLDDFSSNYCSVASTFIFEMPNLAASETGLTISRVVIISFKVFARLLITVKFVCYSWFRWEFFILFVVLLFCFPRIVCLETHIFIVIGLNPIWARVSCPAGFRMLCLSTVGQCFVLFFRLSSDELVHYFVTL